MPFPQQQIDRLAKRLLAGEVVFFVGAGFSVDSEKNTTGALIARLLARFEALASSLASPGCKDRAAALRNALQETFKLSLEPPGTLFSEESLRRLSREYYHFNDWICTAFADLLDSIRTEVKRGARPRLVSEVSRAENSLLCSAGYKAIDPICFQALFKVRDPKNRGKVLFLDTMGFGNPLVMAGEPLEPCLEKALSSYGGRLRARHSVLARLAREGLSSMLLTTNYDLLLEGAYREAGLSPRYGKENRRGPSEQDRLPPAKFRFFSRIADAVDFFGRGEDHETVLIVKIHGCAGEYRRLQKGSADELSSYLPSIVFTFREVQNWREDSWSRDLLRTLLRTRTMVFCGYSGADPVIHDTFRSVYEEMGHRRKKRAGPEAAKKPEDAPAFFLGPAGTREFHGLEILRAASDSVGSSSLNIIDHPNYLRFYRGDDKRRRFPTLDELMRWMFHIVVRSRQAQLLESDLPRVAMAMLGHPAPEADLSAICGHFGRLRASETGRASQWKHTDSSRPGFERIVGWTEGFHGGFLRELALADILLRDQRPGADFRQVAQWPWYKPIVDHPDRSAWGVVVELALRRLLAGVRQERRWAGDSPEVQVVSGSPPAVAFSTKRRTPVCLTIRLIQPGRLGVEDPAPRGFFSRHVIWGLQPESVPWPREAVEQPGMDYTPSARDLWQLASQPRLQGLIKKLEERLEPWK